MHKIQITLPIFCYMTFSPIMTLILNLKVKVISRSKVTGKVKVKSENFLLAMQEHWRTMSKGNDLEMTFDLEVTLTLNVKVIRMKCWKTPQKLGSAFFEVWPWHDLWPWNDLDPHNEGPNYPLTKSHDNVSNSKWKNWM